MGFAERLNGMAHASDARLLAIVAGKAAPRHVASCASCQSRLDALRAWTGGTAAEGAAIADDLFTPDRLAAQRARILKRLAAAGRSARVISFPAPAGAPPVSGSGGIVRWAAAAAVAGLMVGLGSGMLLRDRATPAPAGTTVSAPPAVPLSAIVAAEAATGEALDEEGLLDAAYERVDVDALRTIDDITPRMREVAVNLPRRPLP